MDGIEPSQAGGRKKHRLFVACRIPSLEAHALRDWAESAMAGLPVRLLDPEALHVTLLFFGALEAAAKDELVTLMGQVRWKPLQVRTGGLEMLGRSALAVNLEASTQAMGQLEDRLGRHSKSFPADAPQESIRAWLEERRNPTDPLERMARYLAGPHLEPERRRQRHGRPLSLHVTVARAKARIATSLHPLRPPQLDFALDQIGLYESFTEPDRSRYELLASSGSV